MTVRYAVTFEFEMKPPLTHRGVAEGSSAATVVKRALKSAMAAYPRVVWSSMNIVLLERLDAADAPAA